MVDRDELDLLIDSALSTYANPEPDSDFDQRILARVAAEVAPKPPRRWLPWAIALPAAACLVLIIVLSGSRHTASPSGSGDHAQPTRQPLIATAQPTPSTNPLSTPVHRTKAPLSQLHFRLTSVPNRTAPLPKLDVFPTQQPLSPEEQAFVEFAARAPEPERQSLVEAQARTDAPIDIATIQAIETIKIQPLETPEEGGN
jgi:hypothetical protein